MRRPQEAAQEATTNLCSKRVDSLSQPTAGPSPIKIVSAKSYATLDFKHSFWLFQVICHFQPIRLLKFKRSITLRWFFYKIRPWLVKDKASVRCFCSFSECADTERILERQVLRARLFGFDFDFFYQQSDAGIKPGTAGWEAQTLPLCNAVPPWLQWDALTKAMAAPSYERGRV